MKNSFFLLVFLLPTFVLAQFEPSPEQRQTMDAMVSAYNAQDFKGMKKPWGLLGKILITKKRLEQQFAPMHQKYGQASIDAISCSSIYQCTALLGHEKDSDKRSYLSFIFSDKAKLQGFGLGYPIYIYPLPEQKTPALSQAEKTIQIDSIVNQYTSAQLQNRFNGNLLVMEGNDTLYQNSTGFQDLKQGTALQADSRFLLASCSKQFTAMAVLLLQKDGLLHVQDRVDRYLPNFPYPNITIEHLLTHTSGLPDYLSMLQKSWDKSQFASNADIVNMLREEEAKLIFEPGKSFDYSNTGYVTLSHLIETVSGESYGAFLQNRIFDPLGMKNTLVVARRKEQRIPKNYALGYVKSNGSYALPDSLDNYDYVTYMDGLNGDDGVSSTTADLVIWNKALNSNKLLSKEEMQPAISKHKLDDGQETNYGYGLFLTGNEKQERLIYHTGYWPGYTTMNMNFPDRDISIIMLSNNSYTTGLLMVDRIAGVVLK